MSGEVSEVTERARDVLAPLSEAEAERAVRAGLERVGAEIATELRGCELLIEKARRQGKFPCGACRCLSAWQ